MSMAAATKPNESATLTPATPGAGFEVSRPHGQCTVCQDAIAPDVRFMAALVESAEGYQRADVCLKCWQGYDHSSAVAFWQTAMPHHEQKKRVFVDDNVLCELFERLANVAEAPKVNFRFVLGLILMRKRLLVYESTRTEESGDGRRDVWRMRFRGREDSLEMVDPQLREEQVREVSQQLSEILNEGI